MVVADFVDNSAVFPVQFSDPNVGGSKLESSINQLRMLRSRAWEPGLGPQYSYLASAMWGGCSQESVDPKSWN